MLTVRKLKVYAPQFKGTDSLPLVKDVGFELSAGQLLGLVGPNGAGKSMLLRAVVQTIASDGTLEWNGEDLRALHPRQRAQRIAYLSQQGEVAWPLRVRDFVALGRLPYPSKTKAQQHANTQAVDAAMQAMELQEFAERRMHTLSGGERARARLARAWAVQAPLLLADEPIAALDPYHQLSVMQSLRQLCTQGCAVAVVLHDLTLASRFCDAVLLLHQGELVAAGSVRQVLTPANLQRVYQVQTVHGEHQAQPFIVPWTADATASVAATAHGAAAPFST